MPEFIHELISPPLFIGIVIGFLGERAWCYLHTVWLDKHRPLPDGRPRPRAWRVDPQRFAALVMVLAVSWSVFKTQANADEAARITADSLTFSAEVQDCQRQFNEVIRASREITNDNDRLSLLQRELLIEHADAEAAWIRSLINPPANIARLDPNDPARTEWGIGVTTEYFDTTTRIRDRIREAQDEQRANDGARPPYPEPTCGK